LIKLKESLIKNKTLKEINFYNNNISDDGCEILNEILLKNQNLEKIDLSGIF
jgi:Ran GTPase-activating protein (RanGAP) involved in mRNA processing and transport